LLFHFSLVAVDDQPRDVSFAAFAGDVESALSSCGITRADHASRKPGAAGSKIPIHVVKNYMHLLSIMFAEFTG